MAELQVALHPFAQFDPIHPGHHDIGDYQVYVFAVKLFQRLQAVVCRDDGVVLRQEPLDVRAHFGMVLDDQNGICLAREVLSRIGGLRDCVVGLRELRFPLFGREGNCQDEFVFGLARTHDKGPVLQFDERARE